MPQLADLLDAFLRAAEIERAYDATKKLAKEEAQGVILEKCRELLAGDVPTKMLVGVSTADFPVVRVSFLYSVHAEVIDLLREYMLASRYQLSSIHSSRAMYVELKFTPSSDGGREEGDDS